MEFSTIRRPRPIVIPTGARPIDRPHGLSDSNTAPGSAATSFPDSPATIQSQSPSGQTMEPHTIPTARSFQLQPTPNPDQILHTPQPPPSHPSSIPQAFFHRPPNQTYDPSMPSIQTAPNGQPISGMGFTNQIDEASNFLFSDEAMWVGMFASAGFSIQDGTFCGQAT